MSKFIGKHNLNNNKTDMENLEEKLLEIFRGVFTNENPEDITLDSEFRDFDQYSSLTQMTLIEEIQEQLNVKLKLLPLIKAETIGDILDIINNQ